MDESSPVNPTPTESNPLMYPITDDSELKNITDAQDFSEFTKSYASNFGDACPNLEDIDVDVLNNVDSEDENKVDLQVNQTKEYMCCTDFETMDDSGSFEESHDVVDVDDEVVDLEEDVMDTSGTNLQCSKASRKSPYVILTR